MKDRLNQQDRDGCTLLHIVASSSEYSQKRSKYKFLGLLGFLGFVCVFVCVVLFSYKKLIMEEDFSPWCLLFHAKEEDEKVLLSECRLCNGN